MIVLLLVKSSLGRCQTTMMLLIMMMMSMMTHDRLQMRELEE